MYYGNTWFTVVTISSCFIVMYQHDVRKKKHFFCCCYYSWWIRCWCVYE
eukprot:UN00434